MSPPAEAVGSIRLRTPAAWVDLDLDPATREASIARVIREHDSADTGSLGAMLETATVDAARQGGVFASLLSDVVGGKAVSASLVVSVVDADPDVDDGAGGPDSCDVRIAIAQGIAAQFAGEREAKAEVRSLEAGPAARVRSRVVVEQPGRASEVESLQYFVPFPDGDRLAVLAFSTPNVALADPFAEVFDAIAGTLQWPS